jgi:hypothetical protein
MKKILAAIIATAAIALTFTSCETGEKKETEKTESNTSATVSTVPGEETLLTTGTTIAKDPNDAFAIDKLNFSNPLPGEYYYSVKQPDGFVLMNGLARINGMGLNVKENVQSDLSVYADRCMANLSFTNLLVKEDTIVDEIIDTSVAGFDAIEYDFTTEQNEFILDENGEPILDENGNETKRVVAVYKNIGVCFFSDTDAYYIFFQTAEADYAAQEPYFREFIAGITVDSHLTADQTTTQSYNYTVDESGNLVTESTT